jgi:hypothetical protein
MKTLHNFLGVIATGAVIMTGLAGCASAPPTVGVPVTRAEARITNPPILGAGILEVKTLAVAPFTVSDAGVMALTYYYALMGRPSIDSNEVEKAFNATKALMSSAGTDVAAIQATLQAYPGSSGEAAGVLTIANKMVNGSATTIEVLRIVHPGVAAAYTESRDFHETVAGALTSEATNVIRATGKFTLAAADAADAVLRGELAAIKVDIGTHELSKKQYARYPNGEYVRDSMGRNVYETVTWTVYDEKVTLEFSYGVESADGTPIGPKQRKSGEAEDHSNEGGTGESTSDLKNFLTLAQSIVALKLEDLSREIASYETTEPISLEALEQEVAKDKAERARIGSRQTTENRTLEPLGSEHKAFSTRFKEADDLAKQGNYQGARAAYGSVYKESDSFAAGYNEAIMAEAAGSLEEAVSLMSALYDATKDSKVQSELTRLQRDLREKQALEKLL